jgi:hypothetical protein
MNRPISDATLRLGTLHHYCASDTTRPVIKANTEEEGIRSPMCKLYLAETNLWVSTVYTRIEE